MWNSVLGPGNTKWIRLSPCFKVTVYWSERDNVNRDIQSSVVGSGIKKSLWGHGEEDPGHRLQDEIKRGHTWEFFKWSFTLWRLLFPLFEMGGRESAQSCENSTTYYLEKEWVVKEKSPLIQKWMIPRLLLHNSLLHKLGYVQVIGDQETTTLGTIAGNSAATWLSLNSWK